MNWLLLAVFWQGAIRRKSTQGKKKGQFARELELGEPEESLEIPGLAEVKDTSCLLLCY